jgi:mannose-6-phosphate isomerase-like protein (cupin superfamily)
MPQVPPAPRRLVAPPHVHYHDDEAWYVLEGVLRVQVGPQEAEVRAGCGVLVPAGTPHTYWNPAPGPARYLLTIDRGTIRRPCALNSRSTIPIWSNSS